MKSVEFRREREEAWRELERLLDRVDSSGLTALEPEQLMRLPVLYRAVLSSLSVARAISLDQNALDYLESLAGRAYFAIYAAKRPPGRTAVDFILRRFPRAVRAFHRHVVLAAALMAIGVVTGRGLTLADPDHFYALVDEEMAGGRSPAASTDDLREVLYSKKDAVGALSVFATFLFTHNARVGILCAALGFAAAVPTLLLLFYNGVTLGAFSALYETRGLGLELWAWILPHGVTELLAIVLCAAAGLAMGESVLFPGRHARLANLALQGRRAGELVVGSVLLFLVAGLIEGLFRQLVHDILVRWALAAATAVFWAVYFRSAGREET